MSHDTQTLDLDAVETYLSANLPGFQGPIEADKFQRGQSNASRRGSC